MIREDPENKASDRIINTKHRATDAGLSMRGAKNASMRMQACLMIGLMVVLLREPTLVALYHTAEHPEFSAAKTGENNEAVKGWKEKHNVLGFFDGRPI